MEFPDGLMITYLKPLEIAIFFKDNMTTENNYGTVA